MTGGLSSDRALMLAGVGVEGDSYLTQGELAERWRVSPRTLERWRRRKVGPAWIRLPGRVLYHVEDVRDFERACFRPADASCVLPIRCEPGLGDGVST